MAILADEELTHASDFYARRTTELRVAADECTALYSRHTQFLIVLALLACVGFYQSVIAKRLSIWAAVLVVPVGGWVVQKRHRCHLKSVQLCSLIQYYENGAARLARNWDLLDEGDKFIDPHHFYSRDLDLFGHGSVYQLLCSARTSIARETLAHWMKEPAEPNEIRARQQAISELRVRRDLPESVATAGPMQASDFRPDFLKAWVAESPSMFPLGTPLLAFLLALAVSVSPILYWFGFVSVHTFWVTLQVLLLTEAVFAVVFRSRVKSILESLDTLSIELPIMLELLRIMEREQFSSAKLKAMSEQLGRSKLAASCHIHRLLRLIRLVKQRQNEWFAYLSYCLLWGTQFAMAIERWRRLHGREMLKWMAVLGELEALLSLSTYSYEHPEDTLPELAETGPVFEAEGIGHPLLEQSTCIRNDFQLGDTVRFLIVSGSNMSGKSTFLRAIGVNAVLAYMGAPVRCTKLRLSPFAIGAAVRVEDSTVDGRSHFLAEM